MIVSIFHKSLLNIVYKSNIISYSRIFVYQNFRLILSYNQYITRENPFLTLPIDLYPVLLITLSVYERYKRLFFPASNSSWLTLMYRCKRSRAKKETNYHSYNYCGLFCSSIAYVIAFREKTITRKRGSSILIVEQFPYIRLARPFLSQ